MENKIIRIIARVLSTIQYNAFYTTVLKLFRDNFKARQHRCAVLLYSISIYFLKQAQYVFFFSYKNNTFYVYSPPLIKMWKWAMTSGEGRGLVAKILRKITFMFRQKSKNWNTLCAVLSDPVEKNKRKRATL